MTKGNLYYYFEGKEEILYFCHDYSLDLLLDLLKQVEAAPARPDVKLARLISGFIHMILDELHGTALTLDLQALRPVLLRKVIAKRDRFDRGMRHILETGMRQGVFAQADPKLLTFAILGAGNWITRWFDPKGRASSTEIADAFTRYLVAGLRPERTRRRA